MRGSRSSHPFSTVPIIGDRALESWRSASLSFLRSERRAHHEQPPVGECPQRCLCFQVVAVVDPPPQPLDDAGELNAERGAHREGGSEGGSEGARPERTDGGGGARSRDPRWRRDPSARPRPASAAARRRPAPGSEPGGVRRDARAAHRSVGGPAGAASPPRPRRRGQGCGCAGVERGRRSSGHRRIRASPGSCRWTGGPSRGWGLSPGIRWTSLARTRGRRRARRVWWLQRPAAVA